MKLLLTTLALFLLTTAMAQRHRETLAYYKADAGYVDGYDFTEETLLSDTRIAIYRFPDTPEDLHLEFIWLEDGMSCSGPFYFSELLGQEEDPSTGEKSWNVLFIWRYSDDSEERTGMAEGQMILRKNAPDETNYAVAVQFPDYVLEYSGVLKGEFHAALEEVLDNMELEATVQKD